MTELTSVEVDVRSTEPENEEPAWKPEPTELVETEEAEESEPRSGIRRIDITKQKNQVDVKWCREICTVFLHEGRLIAKEIIRFFDLFSGIEDSEKAALGRGFTCVGHCEVDAYADQQSRVPFDTGRRVVL